MWVDPSIFQHGTESMIGTLGIMLTSAANALTSENLRICCIIVLCLPITTTFAWEYSFIVSALHHPCSPPASTTCIRSTRCLFGYISPPSVVRESNHFWRVPASIQGFLPIFRPFAMMDWSCPATTLASSKGSDDATVSEPIDAFFFYLSPTMYDTIVKRDWKKYFCMDGYYLLLVASAIIEEIINFKFLLDKGPFPSQFCLLPDDPGFPSALLHFPPSLVALCSTNSSFWYCGRTKN